MRSLDNRLKLLELHPEAKYILSYQPIMNEPKVFHLSKNGVKYCTTELGMDKDVVKFYTKNATVPHMLAISEVFISLYTLSNYKLESVLIDNKRYFSKSPDLLMQLRCIDDNSLLSLFVEVDRGTETYEYMIKKHLEKYINMYLNREVFKLLGTFPPIYFITLTDVRKNGLINKFKPILKKQPNVKVFVFTMKEFISNTLKLIGGKPNEKKN